MNRLARQVTFDCWANQESLRAIQQAKVDSPSLKIAAHIAAVSEHWLIRVEGGDGPMNVWPDLTMSEIELRFQDQLRRWLTMCEQHSDEAMIRYISITGRECVNRFDDVIQEVALHGAHHRGQIALLLRSNGADPPNTTDFIPALRTGQFD
jgi:uncharacterized damage-inducible protein DinB